MPPPQWCYPQGSYQNGSDDIAMPQMLWNWELSELGFSVVSTQLQAYHHSILSITDSASGLSSHYSVYRLSFRSIAILTDDGRNMPLTFLVSHVTKPHLPYACMAGLCISGKQTPPTQVTDFCNDCCLLARTCSCFQLITASLSVCGSGRLTASSPLIFPDE